MTDEKPGAHVISLESRLRQGAQPRLAATILPPKKPKRQMRAWDRGSIRKCGRHTGSGQCPRTATHVGYSDGIAYIAGCEWHVRHWIKYGRTR
jgi:hypothetical protein